ncbi:MAG: hypothetical protein ABI609_04135 [Acidobacteriota bacterium]
MTQPTDPGPVHGAADEHAAAYDTEIPTRGVYWSSAILMGTLLLAMVAMWGLLAGMEHQDSKHSRAASVLQDEINRSRAQGPPGPLLQADPTLDMVQLRAAEDAALTSYGWVDRASGTVRIPIREAINRIAAQGLGGHPAASPMPVAEPAPVAEAKPVGGAH